MPNVTPRIRLTSAHCVWVMAITIMKVMDRKLPVFPDLKPDYIEKSRSYVILDGDLKTEEDVETLAIQMFQDPEASYHYYRLEGRSVGSVLPSQEITWSESELGFYQHLSERDFVRIRPKADGSFSWNWEKEYVNTRPRFVRHPLKLTARKHRQLETIARIHDEAAYREKLRKAAFSFDVFLSFATVNFSHAESIRQKVQCKGKKVFFSAKDLIGGQDFADKIRDALRASTELWLLVSPESLKSEWVMTEWGAAWVLDKPIVPVLYRCGPEMLPERLKRLHVVDLHEIDDYLARRWG